MSRPSAPRSHSTKRAVAGVAAGLVLAAGNLAGALPAQASTDTSTSSYGMRLVVCYYLPWMC
jgi:hypothetical protein